jgi:alkylation response protein AidB-like acyl-CoA dehydrogenase
MDWGDTPEQVAFRQEVRDFLNAELPEHYQRDEVDVREDADWQIDRALGTTEDQAAAEEWLQAMSRQAWVAPHWPEEYGGGGLSTIEQFILRQEMARRGVPVVNSFGVNMFGPTLIAHGSDAQRTELLPSIITGESVWAQGYSEPAAGSDLAALQLRAERDGDEYVLNGQKIWSTGAHTSTGMYLLARTDPGAPKHRGISFLYLHDLKAPGISVRPLINMAFEHHFNEVFFEDVRVPTDQRVGAENGGWYVAMTLLDNERSNIAGAVTARRDVRRLLNVLRETGTSLASASRGDLADRWIESEVGLNFSFRVASLQSACLPFSAESSVSRLFGTELAQRVARSGVRALGLYGGLLDEADGYAPARSRFAWLYLRTVSATIGGGTAEIQRNIIATRGLGLPRG